MKRVNGSGVGSLCVDGHMNHRIRKAEPYESEILSEIAFESKAYWGYSTEFMKACSEELNVTSSKIRSDICTYMVYEASERILGFYALERLSEEEVELDALFVTPKEIGNGIGKALLSHAIEFAKNQGVNSMKIQGDPNAEKFYLASGAELVGKEESASIEGRYLPVFIHRLERG